MTFTHSQEFCSLSMKTKYTSVLISGDYRIDNIYRICSGTLRVLETPSSPFPNDLYDQENDIFIACLVVRNTESHSTLVCIIRCSSFQSLWYLEQTASEGYEPMDFGVFSS